MVAIVIIGILASIAIPNYMESVRKSRRIEAKTTLLALSSAMEKYYLEHNTYVGAKVGDTGFPAATTAPGGYYTISIEQATADDYKLKAVPVASRPQASDVKCTSLTLDSTGGRGITGTGSVATCW